MPVAPVTRRSRNTQGMKFANPGNGDSVVAVARNPERSEDESDLSADASAAGDSVAADAVPSSVNEQVVDGAGSEQEPSAPEAPGTDSTGGNE